MLKYKDLDFGLVLMLVFLGVILYMLAYVKGKEDGFKRGLSKQELKRVYDEKLKDLKLQYDFAVYEKKSEAYKEGYSDCLIEARTGVKKFKLIEDDLSFEQFSAIHTNNSAMTDYLSERGKMAVDYYKRSNK